MAVLKINGKNLVGMRFLPLPVKPKIDRNCYQLANFATVYFWVPRKITVLEILTAKGQISSYSVLQEVIENRKWFDLRRSLSYQNFICKFLKVIKRRFCFSVTSLRHSFFEGLL